MTNDRIGETELTSILSFLFERGGAAPDIAAELAASLVEADLYAHHSHGSRHAASYIDRMKTGVIDGTARPALASEAGSILKIDGNRCFGQLVGAFAAQHGTRAAKEHGVALVATNNSGHFGRNGKWAEIAAASGVASLHFINMPNAGSAIVPFGGREARLTSNPIAIGAPGADGDPVVIDFAVGEVAVNVIKRAFDQKEKLPQKCIVRSDGSLSDDPADFIKSSTRAMLSFGGFKGFALGLFADVFAGAIGGGGVHAGEPGKPAIVTNNMFSIYIDSTVYVGQEQYRSAIRQLNDFVTGAAPAEPGITISMPGDRARRAYARQSETGIEFDAGLRAILLEAAEEAGATVEAKARWAPRF